MQETRYGKQLHGLMTVSRFYMDGMLAGFVVACKEKGKK